ncbi:hypothetical protein YYC_02863 [Plasmodium yoelii 17X]|uniref:PIR protein n=3 Tax=Plasmodium yoelii TaxID=5861 RepID=A0AAF0B3C1_PLAYO|nr:PIR protein [Plasmodium yoelii]ETB59345.1 hypothetical protein YYC_02863 [Plasmodium yoelii 17X]WBY58243.1 PIR protein [Plasmodium yoelii yoelii]CDU85268.1 YIR protein [Plasmodium yoelii]VTZ79163.1 PIR protein [Plasmodium yoelii]|eukprot:XP_022813428.1 PIR protein [Plasmodium yoelii]
MDKNICEKFKNVWEDFPDTLGSDGKYQFNSNKHFKTYCNNNTCDMPLEKINAGCLYLFDAFFKDSNLFKSVANSNINIVEYIMIWLSYMLSLKENNESHISTLQHFYKTDIKGGDKYSNPIVNISEYSSYKELIDTKCYFLSMNKSMITKLYDAFKLLCEMHIEYEKNKSNCTKCSEKAEAFVTKYNELNRDHNNIDESSYKQLLCTLSTDYDNFKNKCNNTQCCKSSPLPTIDKNITVKCSAQMSGDTSSSSIGNKLFIVLSIFVAIGIFLGISYKYSLFGFRKRFQKQKLREKIKNIKKRMNQ